MPGPHEALSVSGVGGRRAVTVTGTTRLICLIGSPIAHSKSPAMHNAAFEATGEDFVYVALDIGPDRLVSAIDGFRTFNVRGGNVTMPLKQMAARLVDRLSSVARLVGAVNTIVNDDGVLSGHNTDGEGYLQGLDEAGVQYGGKKFTIMGAGGAATAVAVQAAVSGARAIAMFNQRDQFFANAERLAADLRDQFGCDVGAHDLADDASLRREIASSDILLNGTSVGMGPQRDQSIIPDATYLHGALVVTDVIAVPAETRLLELARRAGCRTVAGTAMNVFQAAGAFKLWTNKEMPIDLVKRIAFGPTLTAVGRPGQQS
jgi:quinate/shikimate dehydrogenase